VAYYEENTPKGEFVLVIAGAEPVEETAVTMEEGVAMVLRKREEGMRMKDAVREVAANTGLNKNELYAAALKE
jgi:16S rRNA (cytidine1402-2'-O)-methyltransferase